MERARTPLVVLAARRDLVVELIELLVVYPAASDVVGADAFADLTSTARRRGRVLGSSPRVSPRGVESKQPSRAQALRRAAWICSNDGMRAGPSTCRSAIRISTAQRCGSIPPIPVASPQHTSESIGAAWRRHASSAAIHDLSHAALQSSS